MEPYLLTGFAILLLLFFGSAIFSAAETSLISLNRHRLRIMQEENPGKAKYLGKWIDNPNRLLTTMLIGINVLNITSAIIADGIISKLVTKWHMPEWSGMAISIGFVSMFILIFCEFIPKIIAYNNSEKYALKLIRLLLFADRAVAPLGNALLKLGNLLIRAFGGKPGFPQGVYVTEAEIMHMVDRGEAQGVIEKDESEMIRGIFELDDTQVREVMIPRPDMDCITVESTAAQVASFIDEANHSRIPVFDGNEDNIVGIINSNVILKALRHGRDDDNVREMLHEAYFVPESKMIDELLHEFQATRVHLAIVVDEYGSTAGLVTLEDLLEEIVGEIRDEFDTEEPLYRWISNDAVRVNARADVTELNESLDINLPDEEAYESLGGLIMCELGRLPKIGETLKVGQCKLSVEKMSGRRITCVIIRNMPTHEETGPDGENTGEDKNSEE